MKKGIIDRFEGDYAMIEVDAKIERIDRKLLPPSAKEGDSLIIDGTNITIDIKGTEERREQVKRLMDKLFK